MNVVLDLGINVVMSLLLAATIFYCWLLNKRIQVLQDSKSELANLLKHFDQSTLKASESVIALQNTSKKIVENIQARIEKANYVMDDLNYLIDRAGKAADQIEAGIAIARQKDKLAKHTEVSSHHVQVAASPHFAVAQTTTPTKPVSAKPTVLPSTPETLSQAINLAEMVLDNELKPMRSSAFEPESKPASTLSSLQALIEKVAERRSDPVLRSNQKNPSMGRAQLQKPRSKSEEELIDALRFSGKI